MISFFSTILILEGSVSSNQPNYYNSTKHTTEFILLLVLVLSKKEKPNITKEVAFWDSKTKGSSSVQVYEKFVVI